MSNPFDEFVSEYCSEPEEKTAGFFDVASKHGRQAAGQVGKGVMHGVGAAAAAGVVGGVGLAASKIYDAATKSRDFRAMLSNNPDLQEHHERNPRMFNQMYSSLRNMNPAYAKDPLVAGTYMRQMSENPTTSGGLLTDAAGMRDKFPSFMERASDEGSGAAGAWLRPQKQEHKP